MEFLIAEKNKLMYRRYNNKDEILVGFNLEENPETFELPAGFDYLDLFNNKTYNNAVTLEPANGVILKRLN